MHLPTSTTTTTTTTVRAERLQRIVRIGDLTRADLCALFDLTDYVRSAGAAEFTTALAGTQLVTAFFEPSTRTRLSFQSAMLRLGGTCHGFTDVQQSRMSGISAESMADTARMLGMYGDVIVVRHPQTGCVHTVAENSGVPTVNGGDGTGEHPTQAMIDLYTIADVLGYLDGVRVLVLNDLQMRCVRSLAAGLALFDGEIHLVRDPGGVDDPTLLADTGVRLVWHDDVTSAMTAVDAVYVSPTVHKITGNPVDTDRTAGALVTHVLRDGGSHSPLILHPLPRGAELPTILDDLPQSVYFAQARHAVALRMALFLSIFPNH